MWVFTALNFQAFDWSCIFLKKTCSEMFYTFCIAIMSIIALWSKTLILTLNFLTMFNNVMHVKNELLWSQFDEAQILSSTDVQRDFIMLSSDLCFSCGWMGITVQTEMALFFVRPVWLPIVLSTFSFDSFDRISQGGLIHFVIGICMWASVFVAAEAVGAAWWTSWAKRSLDWQGPS